MDFELSDEQRMLRETVERFGAEHYDPSNRLRLLAGRTGDGRTLWETMGRNGWLALPIPEALGGLGGTPADIMVLMEVFGRHLILEPFATTCVLATDLLGRAVGSRAASVLQGIAAGELQVATAASEPGAGFDLHRISTAAVFEDGIFRISGKKPYVENGADADWFIVPARTRGAPDEHAGISLFLIPRDASGLRVDAFRSIDHHRHARLDLSDVAVYQDSLLGPLDGGLPLLQAAVDRTIVSLLAEAVGCMDVMRDSTLAFLKTRHQFGVAIGSFQALQHRMVDIAIACEEARSMMYHATLHLNADASIRRRAVSAAKTRVGQTGLLVGRQCVQLHGGVGVSDELIISHYLRRLMMIDLAYGNADYHRTVFASVAA